MKVEEYVSDILLSLGAPVVEVEVKNYIEKIVDMAFREIKHYITDTETVTLQYFEKMHIEDPKIDTVAYVTRSNTPNRIADFQDIMYLMSRQSSLQQVSLTDYSRALLTQQLKNSLATDMDFYWDKKNKDLYVYANYPKPERVTIVYIPDREKIEDITEPFWENLLRRLALALTKQMLGRVRGKYTLNSATYNLDADQLLAESQQELQEIRSFLNENSDLLLPID